MLKPKDVSLVLLLEDFAQDIGLICKALAKGKVVLVDHPFARDHSALEQVLAIQQSGGGVLQVGFRRRFAPLIQDARVALDSMRGRRHVVLHANAGRSLAELRAALPFDLEEQTNTLRALLALRRAIETDQRVTLG